MLKYATTLSKSPETREDGIKMFMSGLNLIKEFKECFFDADLVFNLLLYMLMESQLLNNGTEDFDLAEINKLIEKETVESKYTRN